MSGLPDRPPDWRTWAGARLRHALVRPITPGAARSAVALAVLTLVLFGANLLFTAREVGASRANAVSIAQLCQAGNEGRREVLAFGEYLVAISKPPPHEAPAARAARLALIQRFLAHLHKTLAPRNCAVFR